MLNQGRRVGQKQSRCIADRRFQHTCSAVPCTMDMRWEDGDMFIIRSGRIQGSAPPGCEPCDGQWSQARWPQRCEQETSADNYKCRDKCRSWFMCKWKWTYQCKCSVTVNTNVFVRVHVHVDENANINVNVRVNVHVDEKCKTECRHPTSVRASASACEGQHVM